MNLVQVHKCYGQFWHYRNLLEVKLGMIQSVRSGIMAKCINKLILEASRAVKVSSLKTSLRILMLFHKDPKLEI